MTQYYKKDDNGEFVEARLDQEDINDAVKARIDRINNKYSDYEALKEQISNLEAKQKEDANKLSEALTDKANLEDELKAAKLETEKVRIVSEFKLSDELAEFVSGDTVDEMRERATKLAHNMQPTAIDITKEQKPEPAKSDMAKLADKVFGVSEEQ